MNVFWQAEFVQNYSRKIVLNSQEFFERYSFWIFQIYSNIFEEKVVAALNQLVVQALEKLLA